MTSSTSMAPKFKRLDDALDSYKKAAEKPKKSKIRRVPFVLREHENIKKHFEPRVVAIGPIHHGEDKYQPAERIKERLAAQFIEGSGLSKETLFYRHVRLHIEELKGCYATDIVKNYDDDELAWILFVDGCALLHFLQYSGSTTETSNALGIKLDLITVAMQDLLFLENQLPYQLLELLMKRDESNSTMKHDDSKSKLNDLIKKFIGSEVMGYSGSSVEKLLPDNFKFKPLHLLDILRRAYLGEKSNNQQQQQNGNSTSVQQETESTSINICTGNMQQGKGCQNEANAKREEKNRPSIVNSLWSLLTCKKTDSDNQRPTFRNLMELKAAGINVSTGSSCLNDISFKKNIRGTLILPPITVDDSTASILLNLAAYEMCPDFPNDFGISSYICFMDSLIDHAEDVKQLRKANVLYNMLGSDEEVAKLFNEISTGLVQNPKIYQQVQRDIQSHFNKKFATWIEQGYHEHFSSPWSILAFLGAVTGLILSLLQTMASTK